LRQTEPVEQYLQTFSWNKVKYRSDKPIAELIDSLRKVSVHWRRKYQKVKLQNADSTKQELVGVDNDVKSKFSQYNNTKNNLATAQRKQT